MSENCDTCGRFMSVKPGASSAQIFDFAEMEPLCDRFRCVRCTSQRGPVKSNARPADGNMDPYQSSYTT